MSDLYQESDCDHSGWRATVSGHPQCLDCGGLLLYVVPVPGPVYTIEDIPTNDAFVNGGYLAINARSGKHEGVLVEIGDLT